MWLESFSGKGAGLLNLTAENGPRHIVELVLFGGLDGRGVENRERDCQHRPFSLSLSLPLSLSLSLSISLLSLPPGWRVKGEGRRVKGEG